MLKNFGLVQESPPLQKKKKSDNWLFTELSNIIVYVVFYNLLLFIRKNSNFYLHFFYWSKVIAFSISGIRRHLDIKVV